jgi:hypothetical protein
MMFRRIFASVLVASSLVAVPVTVMAADQLQTRDRLHTQDQTADQLQTRDRLQAQDQTASQLRKRDRLHAQDQAIAPKKVRTQKRERTPK